MTSVPDRCLAVLPFELIPRQETPMWLNFVQLWHKSAAFRICVAVVAVGLATLYFQGSSPADPTSSGGSPAGAPAATATDPQSAPATDPSGGTGADPTTDPVQAGADIANDVINTFDRSVRRARN